MKQISLFLIALIVMINFSGCRKWLEIDLPADQLTASAVFIDDISATAALRGMYSEMNASRLMYNPALTIAAALSADELLTVTASIDYDPFMENDIPAGNYVIGTLMWPRLYKLIYIANDIIEKSANSPGISLFKKKELKGEALLVRSINLFYLCNLFDSIPLTISTDYRTNSVVSRTDPETIYNQIAADLKTADSLLSPAYPASQKIRPNKWAAKALLARIHLFRKQWEDAITQATGVIEQGGYDLDSLDQIFLATSKEAIFQLASVETYGNNAYLGQMFVPTATTVPAYQANPLLLQSFEPGDRRREAWFTTLIRGSDTYVIPYKYKLRSVMSPEPENNTVLRLAEVLLIRAEAYAETEQKDLAVSDLNRLRKRAGLLPLNADSMTPQEVKAAVAQERKIELCIEYGHRWLDLKRTGTINTVMNAAKPDEWHHTAAYYPIPLGELRNNPTLTQNAGYEE